jgi:hypothetical protein
VPADGRDHVRGAVLGGEGHGGPQQGRPHALPAMGPVHDERVDGDLRRAQHEGERVDAEHGQPDGVLAPRRVEGGAGCGVRAGQDGEDDAVRGLPGQHTLGVRVGAVLADERQHGGQVVDACRARHDSGTRHTRHGCLPWTVGGDCTAGTPRSWRRAVQTGIGTGTACRGKVTGG